MDAFLNGMSWDTGERHDMGEMNIDGGLFFCRKENKCLFTAAEERCFHHFASQRQNGAAFDCAVKEQEDLK